MIENPEELAALFATAVTCASDNRRDFVARNGEYSIFALLSTTLPEVQVL